MRTIVLSAVCAALALAAPANAQLYWLPPDISGPPVTTYEDGIGLPLPGATLDEQKAGLVWNMRSGLNVAALQCGFDSTLRTADNYNAILTNHSAELRAAFAKLEAYFKRVNSSTVAGQRALDAYSTRTYASFSTVGSQLSFCTAAAKISQIALFTPRGRFITFTEEHLRPLRNSVKLRGEQQFRYGPPPQGIVKLPNFDRKCWSGDKYKAQCGLY